jgi:hypothetical protein
LPLVSNFNSTSQYEADVEYSAVSIISKFIGIYQIDIRMEMIIVNRKNVVDITKCQIEGYSKRFFLRM